MKEKFVKIEITEDLKELYDFYRITLEKINKINNELKFGECKKYHRMYNINK